MATPQTTSSKQAPEGFVAKLKARNADRERARAAEGKQGLGRTVTTLLASLALLVLVVILAASYLFSGPGGRTVSVGAAESLAKGSRVESAVLLDQDNAFVLHLRSVKDAVAVQNGS
ncbi:MAG: hypothetical protein JWO12_2242, partial [Frankiales bacterium]|nr:hypothetical protein [Frankiales bacterium]